MNVDKGNNEISYQLVMRVAMKMMQSGLISDMEYKQFERKMLVKYTPVFGVLFSGMDLQ